MRKLYYSLTIILCLFIYVSCSTESTPVYTLSTTASPTEAGTVSPSNGEFDQGEIVEVTAQPSENWVFEGWEGDASGLDNPTKVTMDGNRDIAAVFIREYPLTVNIEGEGLVQENVVQGKTTDYSDGTVVELTANPESGWEFDRWGGDLTGDSNPETITVDEAKEVSAHFVEATYNIQTSIEGIGNITLAPEKDVYMYGDEVIITIDPADGWSLVYWDGDIEGIDREVEVTIESNLNINAVLDENPFAGGNGTVEYPYLISTIEQLQKVEDYIDGNFKLISDIDASDTVNWDGGKGFMPLFLDSRINFNGNLDGQGFTISNLYINRSGEQYIGLFGSINSDSVIRNMLISEAKIKGGNRVGVLVGSGNGKIANVQILNSEVIGGSSVGGVIGFNVGELSTATFSGTVNGGSDVGGIAGSNNGGISRTCAHAVVKSQYGDNIGGVVGRNFGRFELSCSTGEVNGNDRVGGLIGEHRYPFDNISKSYSRSTVKGNNDVGGLIGSNIADDELKNSYSSGKVTGNEYVGGLMGLNDGYVSGFYWDFESSGMDEAVGRGRSIGTNSLNSSQMTGSNAEENMSKFDWENVWVTTDDYPILRWELSDNE